MATGYLARRNELAQQRGFQNYYEERQFREEHAEELRVVAEERGKPFITGSPEEAVSFYENVWLPMAENSSGEATGTMRHLAVRYFKEQGYSEEEAIDAMRELYGDSPGAE